MDAEGTEGGAEKIGTLAAKQALIP